MKITTRVFGEIEIDDSKIIRFPAGIIGFPQMTDFVLVYDEEKGKTTPIRWLQSLQETEFALPVMDPLLVATDYNPEVEDDYLPRARPRLASGSTSAARTVRPSSA